MCSGNMMFFWVVRKIFRNTELVITFRFIHKSVKENMSKKSTLYILMFLVALNQPLV